MTRVKICGCTSYDDAAAALEAGADAVGFIFAPSERQIEVDAAAAVVARLGPFGAVFGVFVDPKPEDVRYALDTISGLRLQFSGDEPPELCEGLAAGPYLKVFHLGGERDDAEVVSRTAGYVRALPLFDAWHPTKRGGTGAAFGWTRLRELGAPAKFAVSGGLTPENVGECVRLLRPSAVDVRSGVESNGCKDSARMRAFVRAVREADAQA